MSHLRSPSAKERTATVWFPFSDNLQFMTGHHRVAFTPRTRLWADLLHICSAGEVSGMVVDWPHSFGCIREGLVPEELLQQMRRESGTVAQCPNFWTAEVRSCLPDRLLRKALARYKSLCWWHSPHKPVAQSRMRDPGRPCTAFEAAIAGLYADIIQPSLPSPCAGAEWWVQVRRLLPCPS